MYRQTKINYHFILQLSSWYSSVRKNKDCFPIFKKNVCTYLLFVCACVSCQPTCMASTLLLPFYSAGVVTDYALSGEVIRQIVTSNLCPTSTFSPKFYSQEIYIQQTVLPQLHFRLKTFGQYPCTCRSHHMWWSRYTIASVSELTKNTWIMLGKSNTPNTLKMPS